MNVILAGNWKMHHGPAAARAFLTDFLSRCPPQPGRVIWLFPPAISITTVAALTGEREDVTVGAQNVHWESGGAFTGEMSVPMLAESGATAALVGHSERRHVFGETDAETGRKASSLLDAGLTPVFCVGETLDERDRGETTRVVHRQLKALDALSSEALGRIVVAYEPVWAIGTGKNATPSDAAAVHASIRAWFDAKGIPPRDVPILYGGSVKPQNAAALLAESEIDGVLVGGASLDPVSWSAIVRVSLD